MKIKSIFDKLNKFGEKNNIDVFEGFVQGEGNTVVWTDDSKVEEFLNFLRKIGVKGVFYFILDFQFEEEFEDLEDEFIEGKGSRQVKSLISKLKNRNGDLKSINICGVSEGVSFEYFKSDETIVDQVDNLKTSLKEWRQKKYQEQFTKVNIQTRSKIAHQVASDYEYFRNITRPKNVDKILEKFLQGFDLSLNKLDFSTRRDIRDRIESLFEKKYKPEHEKKLINMIREYKSQGMTKKEMVAKLKITQGILDKYYYL